MAVDSWWDRVKVNLKTLRIAAWLGWQIESNWTSPWIFATYALVKPIAATLILTFIYIVAGGADMGDIMDGTVDFGDAKFTYIFIGNAFYMYVIQVLFGVSWVIHDEREHYETLKYVYTAPISMYAYLTGRAFAKFIFTSLAVVITLAFGVLILGIGIDVWSVNFPLFAAAFVVGIIGLSAFGIILGAIALLTARHGGNINEGVAGMFYLLSGVMYPISVLPGWVQGVSRVLPPTYWLEAVRRALMAPGDLSGINTTLQAFSDWELLGILGASTVMFYAASVLAFILADHVARKKGLIDMHTAY